jgi:hypothetical protein
LLIYAQWNNLNLMNCTAYKAKLLWSIVNNMFIFTLISRVQASKKNLQNGHFTSYICYSQVRDKSLLKREEL